MIDLPRLPVEQVQHNQLTPFAVELLFFLEALGIEADTINSLKKFDFRQTADLAFVHSIGGAHADWKREGFCGLGTSVRALGLNSERAPKVDFVAASLGNLSDSFLKSMYLATMGHTQDAQKNHTWLDDQANGDPPSKVVISDTDVKNNCRIYFPTEQTVEASKGGKASGGTICFQRKWYENAGFPRSLMVDMKSTRKGMLSHSKMIFVRGPKPWVYVGSANLSEAAWGQLVRDKKTGEPRHIRCRNWECGVICPVPIPQTLGGGSALAEQSRQVMGMEIFHGHVPVPMMVPAEAYEGKEPWFFNSV
ncbi:tyrosyl-dna phosphodiesterase domain-containing protein [Phlyctema vagabunda]|uniref:Tyrosyl-dna phosphodiesterase domain-containing protein n=1 Tax=Phlyctema vagabunda TaxID=108571 RepID=A0ABR4PR11_9HELO